MKPGIVLHGNLPLDTIYTVPSYPAEGTNNVATRRIQRPGGIANLAWAFKELNPKFPIIVNASLGLDWPGTVITNWFKDREIKSNFRYRDFTSTSSATIILNESTGKQTSVVNWAACYRPPIQDIYENSKEYIWSHFAYIDTFDTSAYKEMVPILKRLREEKHILSTDLAGISGKDIDLSLFHYLFVSLKDRNKNIIPPTTKTWTIFHNPSVIHLNWHYNGAYIGNLNPNIVNCVGAGDVLAAVTIYNVLDGTPMMLGYDDLERIYNKTEELLLRRQW